MLILLLHVFHGFEQFRRGGVLVELPLFYG